MPATKFTAEQLADIYVALQAGLCNARWEGLGEVPWAKLDRAQRQAQLAIAKHHAETSVAQLIARGVDPKLNLPLLARFDLEIIDQDEAREVVRREELLQLGTGSRRVRGLQMAVNDLLSHAAHFSPDQRRAVENRLAAKGLPPLWALSVKLQRILAGILRRGRIRNEDEYYIAKEAACNLGSDISDKERLALDRMLSDFEG